MTNWYIGGGDNSAPSTDPTTGGDWTNSLLDFDALIAETGPALANGDTVFVKDTHSESKGTLTTHFAGITQTNPVPVTMKSVDVNDTSVYKRGAKIAKTGTADIIIDGSTVWYGFDFQLVQGDLFLQAGGNSIFNDCEVVFTNATGNIDGSRSHSAIFNDCRMGSDGVATVNTLFSWSNADDGMYVEWNGGSVLGTVTRLFNTVSLGAAHFILLNNLDLSANLTTSNALYEVGQAFSADTANRFIVKNCKLASSQTIVSEIQDDLGGVFEMWNTDDSTGDENHRFFIRKFGGDIESETSIVRTATQALPGAEKLSMKVTTSVNASPDKPLKFNIPVRYANIGDAGENLATIFLTSDSSLNDDDFWAVIQWPDGTTKIQSNVLSSAPTISGKPFSLDPLASSTGLTTTSSLWTNPKTNQFKLELDTSVDAGVTDPNVAPQITLFCGKPSITVFVCSQADLS